MEKIVDWKTNSKDMYTKANNSNIRTSGKQYAINIILTYTNMGYR